jgi:hypothetical protein
MFETFGDGQIQHSADWPVTTEFLADFLLSMAQCALTDEEFTQELFFTMHRGPSERDIEFAASVIYKKPAEGKEYSAPKRYFSLEERKISSAESKRHDKRYFEIGDQFDGSGKSIIAVLCWEKRDWLGQWEAYQTANAVYQWCQKRDDIWMELPGKHMRWFEADQANENEKARLLRDAYDAMRNLTDAYNLRQNVMHVIERATEQAAKAAQKTEVQS